MTPVKRLLNRTTAYTHDLLMIPVAWMGAYWLRFNLEAIPEPYLSRALALLPLVVVVQGMVLWGFGLYRGVWRFASLPDLVKIVKAVLVGTLACTALIFLVTRLHEVPRSVFPLYGMLLVLFIGGPRVAYRWLKDHHLYYRKGKRVLVVGAGSAGEMLVRDLLRDADAGYLPVGFVDDDMRKHGRDIQGIRVLGGCPALPDLVRDREVDTVFIALPSANSETMRHVVECCERAGVPFQTLPRTRDLLSGRVSAQALREVGIDDLLGREPVRLDWASITGGLEGRRVLVTGGGGSIGSELCRQIARVRPSALLVLDNSEFNLFRIENELGRRFPDLALNARLADVSDPSALMSTIDAFKPEVVFHAAAYKHVPLLESQPREAVRVNILGTRNVAEASVRSGAAVFVLISTDKAVNPTNVMGTTKRVAEILCQGMDKAGATRFVTVRFGNVLDSAGSVVPTFREQIGRGGPVTVTHPDIERFFMTIPEACQLIMQASVLGKGGEILVLDMGEPVKIRYLADQMIRLSGKVPGDDIEIVYTGLRPGEKLYEELFHHEEETLVGTGHEKVLLARTRRLERRVWEQALVVLDDACARYDEQRIVSTLAQLVPESSRGDVRSDNVVQMDQVRGRSVTDVVNEAH